VIAARPVWITAFAVTLAVALVRYGFPRVASKQPARFLRATVGLMAVAAATLATLGIWAWLEPGPVAAVSTSRWSGRLPSSRGRAPSARSVAS
jgi:hypothetical protein